MREGIFRLQTALVTTDRADVGTRLRRIQNRCAFPVALAPESNVCLANKLLFIFK